MAPWTLIGEPMNTVITWGWAFGGRFFDYATGRITADHPANVAALEWVRPYYDQYNTVYEALRTKLTQGETVRQLDLFMNGLQAMCLSHSGHAKQIASNRPDLDMGIATIPHRPEAGSNPTWLGGWTLLIPKGAEHPDLAWEFIKEVTATEEGTSAFAITGGYFTGFIPSPSWEWFSDDPVMGPFVEIVLTAQHIRPGIPVYQTYAREMAEAHQAYLAHEIHSAKEALAQVTQRVQKELDETLSD